MFSLEYSFNLSKILVSLPLIYIFILFVFKSLTTIELLCLELSKGIFNKSSNFLISEPSSIPFELYKVLTTFKIFPIFP